MQFNLSEIAVTILTEIATASLLLAAGCLIGLAFVYVFVYLWAELTRGASIQFVRPILTARPNRLGLYLLLPGAALISGIIRTAYSLHSIYVEAVKTKTPDDIKSVPSGVRFRARGSVSPRKPVTGPITGESAALVFWTIDGWTGTRWKQCASELRTGRFEITGTDRYDEPVVVLPDEETEYSLESAEQEVRTVEKNEPVPDDLRQFLQEHAPFAPGTVRFREIRVEDGEPLSVFGKMTEQNIQGRWERVVEHPDADGVRVVVTTEDVEKLVKEVWRDTSTGLIWGLGLLAYGAVSLAAFAVAGKLGIQAFL